VPLESIPELGEAVAAARDEDAGLLASRYRCIEAHRVYLSFFATALRAAAMAASWGGVKPSAKSV
jgi:hypothetical protein